MDPADATKVKTQMNCLTCHQPHSSAQPGLLVKDQANNMAFCDTCHKNRLEMTREWREKVMMFKLAPNRYRAFAWQLTCCLSLRLTLASPVALHAGDKKKKAQPQPTKPAEPPKPQDRRHQAGLA